MTNAADSTASAAAASVGDLENAAKRDLRRKLSGDLFVAHRLAGCTVFNLSDNRIGLRFETSFAGNNTACLLFCLHYSRARTCFICCMCVRVVYLCVHVGRYHESFFVLLSVVQQEPRRLALFKHTVPYFIPLPSLVDAHLNTDIKARLSVHSRVCCLSV